MRDYSRFNLINLEATCVSTSIWEWQQYMENAKRANKRKINSLIKRDLPDLYESLALHLPNPYNYFITDRHIVLVHSGIEYFITYNKSQYGKYRNVFKL